jgi:hypothetical protein
MSAFRHPAGSGLSAPNRTIRNIFRQKSTASRRLLHQAHGRRALSKKVLNSLQPWASFFHPLLEGKKKDLGFRLYGFISFQKESTGNVLPKKQTKTSRVRQIIELAKKLNHIDL